MVRVIVTMPLELRWGPIVSIVTGSLGVSKITSKLSLQSILSEPGLIHTRRLDFDNLILGRHMLLFLVVLRV